MKISAVTARMTPGYLLVALWLLVWAKFIENLIPEGQHMSVKLITSSLYVILFLLLWRRPQGSLDMPSARNATWLIPLISGAAIVWSLAKLSKWFSWAGYTTRPYQLVIVGAAFLLLALVGWRVSRGSDRHQNAFAFLLLSTAVLLIALFVAVKQFPLHGDRSDMLPVIVSGIQRWFGGDSPYAWHYIGTHKAPLAYLPALWLPYIPVVRLGLDPRWLTFIIHIAFVATQWFFMRPSFDSEWWPYLLLIALNPFIVARHDLHVYPIWLFVAVACVLMLRRQWIWAAIAWGLLIAGRHTLWIPFPFVVLYLWTGVGKREALRFGLIAVGLAVALITAFAVTDVQMFIYSVFGYTRSVVVEISTQPWSRVAGWLSGFSVVPLLYRMGVSAFLQPIQFVLVSILAVIAFLRRPSMNESLWLGSIALLIFLLLNPLSEAYMYGELLVLAAFTTFAATQR